MTAPHRITKTAEDRIPGDLTKDQLIARILRVDQAGELGAVRIYQGQRAILGKGRHGPLLTKMAEQEQHHLDTFSRLISERRVRPTMLAPIWHVAGFALGAATALMGERAAMACTVAVEEAIDEHYADQHARLGDDEAELKATIEKFREEELEHRDIGLANEAEKAPGYPILSAAIKTGCRMAIWLSERV
ncbi:MAG TPA: demethoxyubiquinone hydroxylase family protein [Candidatus Omnitrophota bacterium]|nr:demethoxyubiquinone hydroxylase family protein [Candidatus Omnitrophota bacterium]